MKTTIAIIISIASFTYLLPFAVAYARGHHNTLAIFMLNAFAGWTLIGWVWALVWACTQPPQVA